MDEVLVRRKRTGALLIIPLVLAEMIVGACFLYVLLYMPNIFLILELALFLLVPFIVIIPALNELSQVVKLCDGKIFIKYSRKYTSDSINNCEYESSQRIVNNIRGDVITLRLDQKHFIRINEKEWENYEGLLEFIVNNGIEIKTNHPKDFAKVKKRILSQNKNSKKSDSRQIVDRKTRKLSIREKILVVVLTCFFGGFGVYIDYLAIKENEISYKTILTFVVGILIALVGVFTPALFRKK